MGKALALGNPSKVLSILVNILEEENEDDVTSKIQTPIFRGAVAETIPNGAVPIAERLDGFVMAWSDDDLMKVVSYVKDWNTNAKHSFVAQILISSMLRVLPIDRLLHNRPIAESIAALAAYTDRHYARLDKLHQASYLLEYMSSTMSLLPLETVTRKRTAAARDDIESDDDSDDEELVIFPVLSNSLSTA